jgi:hypothetical protein
MIHSSSAFNIQPSQAISSKASSFAEITFLLPQRDKNVRLRISCSRGAAVQARFAHLVPIELSTSQADSVH